MNLTEMLAILKEVNQMLTLLNQLGLKISGTLDLHTLLGLLGVKLG